jgi:hypothetical protein
MDESRPFPVEYRFVPYGTILEPEPRTLVLDVGMKTMPGVIDHHHSEAECECAASLVARRPDLVLDHIPAPSEDSGGEEGRPLVVVTHRMPDFDSVAAVFLALRLVERRALDPAMTVLADYTKLVDSALLPREIDLAATPYAVMRSLFRRIRADQADANLERMQEGQRFMRFLHARAEEGHDILENRSLFTGIERFERAMRICEEDHFAYLADLDTAERMILSLPLENGEGRKSVEGLAVVQPRSFLFRDWAQRDRDHTRLRRGFSFLMTVMGRGKVVLGVEPGEGVWLKGLGKILNDLEEARCAGDSDTPGAGWYEGGNSFFNYRILASPRSGTRLGPSDILDAVRSFGRAGNGPEHGAKPA